MDKREHHRLIKQELLKAVAKTEEALQLFDGVGNLVHMHINDYEDKNWAAVYLKKTMEEMRDFHQSAADKLRLHLAEIAQDAAKRFEESLAIIQEEEAKLEALALERLRKERRRKKGPE